MGTSWHNLCYLVLTGREPGNRKAIAMKITDINTEQVQAVLARLEG